MSRRRVLEVDIVSRSGAIAHGYGSRDLLTELVGRPPVWSSMSRGWVFQTWRVGNLLALAELRGYDVVVTGPRAAHDDLAGDTDVSSDSPQTPAPEPLADPGAGLW